MTDNTKHNDEKWFENLFIKESKAAIETVTARQDKPLEEVKECLESIINGEVKEQ